MDTRAEVIVMVFLMLPNTLPLMVAADAAMTVSSSYDYYYDYDIVVYGATPAGFSAALAARATLLKQQQQTFSTRVLVIEPSSSVGGMASGGIGLRDCEINAVRENNSTQMQWAMKNAQHYGVAYPVWQPDNYVSEQTFLAMLSDAGVDLWVKSPIVEGPTGVRIENDQIQAIQIEKNYGDGDTENVWVSLKYVVDASYEGEVLIAANATYTFGREARSQYNESLGGISNSSIGQFSPTVSPFVGNTTDVLLPYIQNLPDPRTRIGKADDNLMAYSYRVCLTTNESGNSIPLTAPPGYDPTDFELPRRYVKAQIEAGKNVSSPFSYLAYHGYPTNKSRPMKLDACCGTSAFGIDAVGLARGYANATRSERAVIARKHRYYVQGLMWFWLTDEAVPESIRKSHANYSLCKDEWPDNEHFPTQLYVREAARLVGDRVYSQNDRVNSTNPRGCQDDAIAIASWGIDIHDMQRVPVKDTKGSGWVAYNEGLTDASNGGMYFFEIPYYILLPKRKELTNLAAPNCPSVSHVAFAAIREEPTLWQLGQAAGTAAALAITSGGLALQDVPVTEIQRSLTIDQDAFVHWPPRPNCSTPLPKPEEAACNATKAVLISVLGCGTKDVNGVYKRTSEKSDGIFVFQKDNNQQLYRYNGQWRLGVRGHGIYYSAISFGKKLEGPPKAGNAWTTGPLAYPPTPTNITCTFIEFNPEDGKSKNDLNLIDIYPTIELV